MENIESIQIQKMAELTEEEIAGITPPSGVLSCKLDEEE